MVIQLLHNYDVVGLDRSSSDFVRSAKPEAESGQPEAGRSQDMMTGHVFHDSRFHPYLGR
jgi:hypothetical protein